MWGGGACTFTILAAFLLLFEMLYNPLSSLLIQCVGSLKNTLAEHRRSQFENTSRQQPAYVWPSLLISYAIVIMRMFSSHVISDLMWVNQFAQIIFSCCRILLGHRVGKWDNKCLFDILNVYRKCIILFPFSILLMEFNFLLKCFD